MQSNQAFVPAIVFRCLIWMMTAGLIVVGISPQDDLSTTTLIILGTCTALYTATWCLFLPRIVHWITQVPLLLLLDIILSALPAWVSGGWLSPFVPFMLGALMLPGALYYWRGVIGAIISYVIIDQLAGWTTWPVQLDAAAAIPMFTVGYIRPLIAVLIWPLSFELWKWRTRRNTRTSTSPNLLEHMQPSRHLQPSDATVARRASPVTEESTEPRGAWRTVHQPAQTLERVPVALHMAIQQAVAETQERGLQVHMSIPEQEPVLPQSSIQLLAKAVEIGLSNIESHAATHEAEVSLMVDTHASRPQVVVSVRDHGNGFLDGNADPPGFHQLKRLRYRLAEVEGTLEVSEHAAGGVILVVRIPIV